MEEMWKGEGDIPRVNHLALESLEALLEEVQRRCDACVILLLKDKGGHHTMSSDYQGGYYACLGMVRDFEGQMLARSRERDGQDEGEEF